MRIRILTSLATATRAFQVGDVVTWPDVADAKRMIAAGFAEAAEETQKTKGG